MFMVMMKYTYETRNIGRETPITLQQLKLKEEMKFTLLIAIAITSPHFSNSEVVLIFLMI